MAAVLSTANVTPQSCNAMSQFAPQSQSPMDAGQNPKESKGMGMTTLQERIAQERVEIATRVAKFKATQEKFEREREEYFVTTLENARHGSDGRRHWS
jgi:hypothetical protein